MSFGKSPGIVSALIAVGLVTNSSGDTQMPGNRYSSFDTVLHADGPASDRAEKLALYGQFIGDWDADIVTYTPDGIHHKGTGEIHFWWILQGRAIQDVWMIPRLVDRRPGIPAMPVAGNWYGTTIRAYDPSFDAWHIYWMDPATNAYYQQIGRKQGNDIVQEGATESGAFSRWSFTEITPQSFHWKGEISSDKGATWHLVVEVFAHRTAINR
jgi:hypothetical protein